MADYTKKRPSGRYTAKRGCRYYLYETLEDVQEDDERVSFNLERLNSGESNWCFNRAEEGCWVGKACRLKDLDFLEAYL